MAIDFCGLKLDHPIVNGSGTFDALAAERIFGTELTDNFPFSAFVTKTVTVNPRQGNPPPRLWELPSGMINSIGLPNKGMKRFFAEDLPALTRLPVPLIVNVMGFSVEEMSTLVETFGNTPKVDALELNVSCPNVKTGMVMGSDPGELAALVSAVKSLTSKPLIVKLTPNCTSVPDVAAAAQASGADAISLINTLQGMAFDPRSPGKPWLGGKTGGVSGPGVRPIALAQLQSVSARVDIPIIGMGGVQTAAHAAEFLSAGATLVGVGTESFRDPKAASGISAQLLENHPR